VEDFFRGEARCRDKDGPEDEDPLSTEEHNKLMEDFLVDVEEQHNADTSDHDKFNADQRKREFDEYHESATSDLERLKKSRKASKSHNTSSGDEFDYSNDQCETFPHDAHDTPMDEVSLIEDLQCLVVIPVTESQVSEIPTTTPKFSDVFGTNQVEPKID
jgi:hypothetical protein